MNKSTNRSDLLGDFMKGAVKGIVAGALLMGAMALVFSGLGALGAATGWFTLALPEMLMLGGASGVQHMLSIGGILLTSGLVNGAMRAYHGATVNSHVERGNMREAHLTHASPTLIPLLGMEHGVAADHALEIENHHQPQRQWAQSVNRNGDRVQQILQNGSMSDKDRASAILREREERAAAPQGISA